MRCQYVHPCLRHHRDIHAGMGEEKHNEKEHEGGTEADNYYNFGESVLELEEEKQRRLIFGVYRVCVCACERACVYVYVCVCVCV